MCQHTSVTCNNMHTVMCKHVHGQYLHHSTDYTMYRYANDVRRWNCATHLVSGLHAHNGRAIWRVVDVNLTVKVACELRQEGVPVDGDLNDSFRLLCWLFPIVGFNLRHKYIQLS